MLFTLPGAWRWILWKRDMKNLRLAIFVVGTTVMLWLGCSSRTWDQEGMEVRGFSAVEREVEINTMRDTVITDGAGAMDEMDEVKQMELR